MPFYVQFVGRFGLRFILPVIAVLAGALVTVIVSLDEMADAVNRIEQTTIAHSVEAALKVSLRRIGDTNRDYAQWDDAVRNLYGEVDKDFVRENFVVSTADPVFFDTVILIDEEGREVFGYRDGMALSLPALGAFGADAVARLVDGLPRNGTDYEVRTGIVSSRNGLFAVSVGPVVPASEDFANPPPRARLLLLGRRLDDGAIARLGQDYQIRDLHLVGAVFERIGHAHGLVRQLALFADRHEAGRHLMRHRAADDEAARLDAGDLVDLAAGPRLHQFIHGAAERARIAEQRGDVAEHDAGLGIVRDRADRGTQVVLDGR